MKKPMRVEPVLETPRPSETQAIEIVTSTSPIEPSVNTSTENDNNNNTNDSLIGKLIASKLYISFGTFFTFSLIW